MDIGEFLLLLSPYSQTANIMSILYICHIFCFTAKPCGHISQFLWISVLSCIFKIILYLISAIYHSSLMKALLLQFTKEFFACFRWVDLYGIHAHELFIASFTNSKQWYEFVSEKAVYKLWQSNNINKINATCKIMYKIV